MTEPEPGYAERVRDAVALVRAALAGDAAGLDAAGAALADPAGSAVVLAAWIGLAMAASGVDGAAVTAAFAAEMGVSQG